MQEFSEYLFLLQVSAVTVVACVVILGASADLFAIDPTGLIEPGGGRPIVGLRYRGKTAAACRHMVWCVGAFLAAAYTSLLPAIVISVSIKPGLFTARFLSTWFIGVISVTIIAVCWIVFLAIILRWIKMRASGPFAA